MSKISQINVNGTNYSVGNDGTITGITMNGVSKGTSGVVDLGTVITEHQDISGKQDTLVSGTNIKTINNESILGEGNITIGGGSNYSAGTNIDITDDTISCTLPIKSGTNNGIIIGDSESSAEGNYSLAVGHNANANGIYSVAIGSNVSTDGYMSFHMGEGTYCNGRYAFNFGMNNLTNKAYQFAHGQNITAYSEYEVVFGLHNKNTYSSNTFGDAGNMLFSVGNGYSFSTTNNKHNAFEIRQNGDIYVPNTDDTTDTSNLAYSTYPMVRLQDTITATASNTSALGGLKLVSFTQAQYDALSTKDSSTVYFIND